MKRKDLIAKLDELGVSDDEDITFIASDHYSNSEIVETDDGGTVTVMRRYGSDMPQIMINLFHNRLVRRG